MTSIIVAIDRDGAIGRGGNLLYHIRPDLRHVKALTVGNTVVMGRKTFESLPKGALPDRRNIVITRRKDYTAPGAEIAASPEEALRMASEGPGETFIIGGGEIYARLLPFADRLCLTIIDASTPGEDKVHFPPIDPGEWSIADTSAPATDPDSGLSYTFTTLQRR